MIKVLRWWLCFCVAIIATTAYGLDTESPQSPEQLLLEMDANSATLSYKGTMVYSRGGEMESLKIFHTVIDGVRRERLVHLSGKPREIVREGQKVTCINGDSGFYTIGNKIPAGPFARQYAKKIKAIGQPYRLENRGMGRVAGRSVIKLALIPRDEYRYGFRLALDANTKLLLQSLMLNDRGQVLERFEYTQISLNAMVTEDDLKPQFLSGSKKVMLPGMITSADNDVAVPKSLWKVNWIPQGFSMEAFEEPVDTNRGMAKTRKENSLMYSDGLTAFSVFIAEDVNLGSRSQRRGATTAHTRVNNDSKGVYSVTVVGEIPHSAALRIADSVKRTAAL